MALRINGRTTPTTPSEMNTNQQGNQRGGRNYGNGRGSEESSNEHTLYIGKAMNGIPSRKLAETSDPIWKKQTTFDQLVAVLDSQSGVHDVADLVSALTRQLPINTGNAYAEALTVRLQVVQQVTSVEFLQGVEFLDSKGRSQTFRSASVKKRPSDLMFFKFICTLDGSVVDPTVTQDKTSFQLCLRLPQTLRGQPVTARKKPAMDPACKKLFAAAAAPNGSSDDEDDGNDPEDATVDEEGTKTPQRKKKKKTSVSADDADEANAEDASEDEDEEKADGSGDDGSGGASDESRKKSKKKKSSAKSAYSTPTRKSTIDAMTSPKMSRLLGANAATGKKPEEMSYYGALDFLDNQEAFVRVFGKHPELLQATPTKSKHSGGPSIMSIVNAYADKCMFDRFKASCRNDYVGDEGTSDPLLATQDICDKLSKLRQAYKVNNRTVEDHPEDLFQKFLDISVGLPEDATNWSIQLCSTYYGALVTEIRSQMTKTKFKMPSINGGFNTKTKQLKALRVVRAAAVEAHVSVKDENERIKKLVDQMNGGRRGGSSSHYLTQPNEDNQHYEDQHSTPTDRAGTGRVLFHSDSQAEQTIARYSGNPNAAVDFRKRDAGATNEPTLQTRKNPATGLEHPYNPHTDYVSKFPTGFRGCFRCGKNYHGRDVPCPRQDDRSTNREFWQELWAHKPKTFDPSRLQKNDRDRPFNSNRVPRSLSRYTPSDQNVSIVILEIRNQKNQKNQNIRSQKIRLLNIRISENQNIRIPV